MSIDLVIVYVSCRNLTDAVTSRFSRDVSLWLLFVVLATAVGVVGSTSMEHPSIRISRRRYLKWMG